MILLWQNLPISQVRWLHAERLADVACSATPAARAVRQGFDVRLSEGTVMGGQRQSSSIRQQREMSRKLKAAEKRAKRQSRTTEKPKGGTEGATDH